MIPYHPILDMLQARMRTQRIPCPACPQSFPDIFTAFAHRTSAHTPKQNSMKEEIDMDSNLFLDFTDAEAPIPIPKGLYNATVVDINVGTGPTGHPYLRFSTVITDEGPALGRQPQDLIQSLGNDDPQKQATQRFMARNTIANILGVAVDDVPNQAFALLRPQLLSKPVKITIFHGEWQGVTTSKTGAIYPADMSALLDDLDKPLAATTACAAMAPKKPGSPSDLGPAVGIRRAKKA